MLKGCASDTALSLNQIYSIFLYPYLCEISWLFLKAFEPYYGVYGKESTAFIIGYFIFIAYISRINVGLTSIAWTWDGGGPAKEV